MEYGIIESESQYEMVLQRVDELLNTKPDSNSKEGRELKLLLLLIEKFEDEHYAIDLPDPIEAIKIRMNDLALKPKDLVPSIGDKGTVSKMLNKRIPLSLKMIRNLHQQLGLPLEILMQEVKIEQN